MTSVVCPYPSKCAIRKALKDETASDHTADCVFITGVGAKKAKDPTHVPLRDSVLEFLKDFDPPLNAFVPKDAQGTVVVVVVVAGSDWITTTRSLPGGGVSGGSTPL